MSYPHFITRRSDGRTVCACGYVAPGSGSWLMVPGSPVGVEHGAECPIEIRAAADATARLREQLAHQTVLTSEGKRETRRSIVAWLASFDDDDAKRFAEAIENHTDEFGPDDE